MLTRFSPSRRFDWLVAIIGLLGFTLLVVHLVRFNSIVDDAYISFRYLDNWLSGTGLVYNPGERVEGYTNFLWILLLAPLRLLGLAPELAALLVSLGCLVLLLGAVFRTASALGGDSRAGWSALFLAAGSVALARWTTSGMETVCFAALLALANSRLAARGRHDRVSSALFGLAVLTRPEAMLHALIAFAAALAGQGTRRLTHLRRLLGPFFLFLAFPLAHLAFRMAYYGDPLPNTYYAKLTGDLPNLVPNGFIYLWRFLAAGGFVLVGCALLAFRGKVARHWVTWALALQALSQIAYVVKIGGDYFPFHRFIVPVLPNLMVLAGIGLADALKRLGAEWARQVLVVSLILSVVQAGFAHASRSRREFDLLLDFRNDHELVADWLKSRLPAGSLIAVNVAGRIPYRTGMPTIDMLGLNDRHIARAAVDLAGSDGITAVGHLKHDGNYVCHRAPAAVITSDGALHWGRDAREASMQVALVSFPGDREFLRSPACRDRYRPVADELKPGRYAVVYFRDEEAASETADAVHPQTAEAWFHRGVELMAQTRLEEAITAFQTSLALNPGHPAALTNLGFCLFDLQRYAQAAEVFLRALAIDSGHLHALYGLAQCYGKLEKRQQAVAAWRRYIASAPDSPWKESAKKHLYLLTGSRE